MQLINQASIELVGPFDVDRARVAVVVAAGMVDESLATVVRAIQRDGVPRVLVIASAFSEAGVLQAVAAGVSAFLRRAEATSGRLVELIHQVDDCGCLLPEGLVKRAATTELAEPESDDVLAFLREDGADHGTGNFSTLTKQALSTRELDVLRLLAEGHDTNEVAALLSFSESTIKGVLAKLMARLEARNRCQAVAIGVRQGLI